MELVSKMNDEEIRELEKGLRIMFLNATFSLASLYTKVKTKLAQSFGTRDKPISFKITEIRFYRGLPEEVTLEVESGERRVVRMDIIPSYLQKIEITVKKVHPWVEAILNFQSHMGSFGVEQHIVTVFGSEEVAKTRIKELIEWYKPLQYAFLDILIDKAFGIEFKKN